MDEEIEAIEKNQTWDLVSLPKDKDVIGVKWVYKTKFNEKDEVQKLKARLVVRAIHNNLELITMRYLHL